MRIMAMLGTFTFTINKNDFNRLSRRRSYSFAEIKRARNYDGTQNTGKDTESISISGELITTKSGLRPLQDLEAIADKKEAVAFIAGYGDVFGDFLITEISDERSVFIDDGKSLLVSFGIELKRFRS